MIKHNIRIRLIDSIEEAEREMEGIGVDIQGIKIMAPKLLYRVIKLENVDNRAAIIIKQEMLASGSDAALSRDAFDLSNKKGDVLLMGTIKHYQRLIKKLRMQPFVLPQIADEIENVLANFDTRIAKLRCRGHELDMDKRTLIMGVLNITPDSFFNGGSFLNVNQAVKHAEDMVEQGADIIDIGGESTRPFSEPISQEEEWKRVNELIKILLERIDVPISIDTCKPEIAEKALALGVHMVNDVNGLRNEEMAKVVAKYNVPIIIVHMKGTPKTMQKNPKYEDVVAEIIAFFRERIEYAEDNGISKENVIIDPGIGFGKTIEHNLEIIKRLKEFKTLGLPICMGTSRKSFIGDILNLAVNDRLEGTLAANAASIINGADIIRIHDVKEGYRAAKMIDAIYGV
jgi:dihydropteroate synthase